MTAYEPAGLRVWLAELLGCLGVVAVLAAVGRLLGRP